MSGWLVFGLYAAFMVLLSLAFRRNRRVYREIQDELASIRRDVKLEGTEPLTDEETRALLLMEPSGPLSEGGHEARAVASARAKLRARLARADG